MKPWITVAAVDTREGRLELRRRGEDFLIVVGGRVLMSSAARRSEEALAALACAELRAPAPRVLVAGLGMGFTLRAALDALPAAARVDVAELTAAVVDWCRGPLAALTGGAADDPRVTVAVADVASLIARAEGAYDAIVLDVYEGPYGGGPLFGAAALARARRALRDGGVLAVWSEDDAPGFEARLAAAGFEVTRHRAGGGGRTHVIYLGRG